MKVESFCGGVFDTWYKKVCLSFLLVSTQPGEEMIHAVNMRCGHAC